MLAGDLIIFQLGFHCSADSVVLFRELEQGHGLGWDGLRDQGVALFMETLVKHVSPGVDWFSFLPFSSHVLVLSQVRH